MKRSTVKGLNTPKVFITMRGFFDSKIAHTASIDESNQIVSAYVTTKCKDFNSYAANRIKELEKETFPFREVASELLVDLPGTLDPEALLDGQKNDISTMRNNRRIASRNRTKSLSKNDFQKKLKKEWNQITSAEFLMKQEFEEVSNQIQSCFSSYGYGMRFKPLEKTMIPEVHFSSLLDEYYSSHEELDAQIKKALGGDIHV